MFSCRTCMRRYVQGFLKDSAVRQTGQKRNLIPGYTKAAARRHYNAATAAQEVNLIRNSTSQRRRPEDKYDYQDQASTQGKGLHEQSKWLQFRGNQPRLKFPGKREAQSIMKRDAEKELVWLGDPLKLAERVLRFLKENNFSTAEVLVRTASKNIQCTVSWNHLISWQLSQGKLNSAIKTYNEMKKRGQTPDSYTYTALFKGLAECSHLPQALPKALSIYHSMDAENSPVKPNVIHTNAVLKVCARAGDMDALFGVAAKLQRKGFRAPNNLTFTTIFNAIWQQASKDPTGNETDRHAVRTKAIMDARKIWDDIVRRWHHGNVWIDEELACSMGRILLLGQKQDWDDIFSLVEQTMNIPRFTPKLGTPERNQIEPTHQGKTQSVDTNDTAPTGDDSVKDLTPFDEFRKIKPPSPSQGFSAYAKPGNNALSLILQALCNLRLKRSSGEYWDLFTNTYKTVPDSNNFHCYLRLLRILRASSETVELLLQMPKSMMEKKTFRIAMSTCARDKNNPASFANAGKVLDLMQQKLTDLDILALHSYMEVAIYGHLYTGEKPATDKNGSPDYVRGRQILRALDRLAPAIANVRSELTYRQLATSKQEAAQAKADQDAALALVREMISAYDKLMAKGMVDRERYRELTSERSKLAAFVTRYNSRQARASQASQESAGQEADKSH